MLVDLILFCHLIMLKASGRFNPDHNMQCNLFNEAVSWLKNFFTGIFFQETIKILKVIITEVHLYSQCFYIIYSQRFQIIFSFDFYKNVHTQLFLMGLMLKPKYDCLFDCTPAAHKLFWNYSEIQNRNPIDFDKNFLKKRVLKFCFLWSQTGNTPNSNLNNLQIDVNHWKVICHFLA